MKIIYLTSDLLFSSRVRSLARDVGVELVVVGTRDAMMDEHGRGRAAAVLVDLEHRDAQLADLMKALRQANDSPRVIAYGPHVKESLLQAARDAGCDEVLTRGQFDKMASSILASFRESS